MSTGAKLQIFWVLNQEDSPNFLMDASAVVMELGLSMQKARRIFLQEQILGIITLPETNMPLQTDGWNTTFLLGRPIFRGYVSFRECKLPGCRFVPYTFSETIRHRWYPSGSKYWWNQGLAAWFRAI